MRRCVRASACVLCFLWARFGLCSFTCSSDCYHSQVAVRAVRIDKVFRSEADVAALKSQDKVLSMHEEKRKQKLRAQRCQLSLARLFPHPRPVWTSPAVLGVFGDAFLGSRPSFGVPDVQAWTFIVFNHAFQRAVREQHDFLSGLSTKARAGVDRTAQIFANSRHIFREFQRVLKDRSSRTVSVWLNKCAQQMHRVMRVLDSLCSRNVPQPACFFCSCCRFFGSLRRR